MALAVSCCVLGAGPALKPRLEADPWPGDTIRNAATMTAAKVTGATPNSRVFISVLWPRQARVQPAAPPGLSSRDRPGTPRRGGAAGFANGPAAAAELRVLGSGAARGGPGAAGGGRRWGGAEARRDPGRADLVPLVPGRTAVTSAHDVAIFPRCPRLQFPDLPPQWGPIVWVGHRGYR